MNIGKGDTKKGQARQLSVDVKPRHTPTIARNAGPRYFFTPFARPDSFRGTCSEELMRDSDKSERPHSRQRWMVILALALIGALGVRSYQRWHVPSAPDSPKSVTEQSSEAAVPAMRRIDLRKLDVNDAVPMINGDGSRVLYVFSHPDCGYCQQLEHILKKMDDLTVFTFLAAGRTERSRNRAADVLCAATAYMLNECDTSILDRNQEKMKQFEFDAIPTVILQDGEIFVGTAKAEVLEPLLTLKADLAPSFFSADADVEKTYEESLHAFEDVIRDAEESPEDVEKAYDGRSAKKDITANTEPHDTAGSMTSVSPASS